MSFGATVSCKYSSTACGPHEGLAQAHQAFVGMGRQEDKIAELFQPDGFERHDFHEPCPPEEGRLGSVLSQELPNGPANDLQMGAHRIVPGIVNADDPQVRCI